MPDSDQVYAPPSRISSFLRWALSGLQWRISGLFGLGILVGIMDVLLAFLVGWLVNQIVASGAQGEALRSLTPYIVLIVLLYAVIKPGMQIFEVRWKMVSLIPQLVPLVSQRLFDMVLNRPTAHISGVDASRYSHKILRTANVTSGLLIDILNAFSILVGTLIGVAFLLWGLHPAFLSGLLIWLIAAAANAIYFVPLLRETSSARASANTEVTGELVDALSNLCSVKLFGNEAYESQSAQRVLNQLRDASTQFGKHNAAFRSNLFILIGLLPVGLQAGAVYMWLAGLSGPGEVVALGLIAARIAMATNAASMSMMLIYRNLGEIEHGMTLFSHEFITTPDHEKVTERMQSAETADNDIRFENVSFAYPGRDFRLADINLVIPAGATTAIVGPSGSGKSTLISLFLGLEPPDRGLVYVGGTRVDMLPDARTAVTFALAGQMEVPFNRSLRDNVRYGRLDASDDEVEAIMHLVGLKNLNFAKGTDDSLGPAGRKLSGGQRQRVLIARALLRNAPILVLDEATSALDYPSERALLATIAEYRKGKTTIIVTHRPSALPAFDYVIAIEEGHVAESGPPDAIASARKYFDIGKTPSNCLERI